MQTKILSRMRGKPITCVSFAALCFLVVSLHPVNANIGGMLCMKRNSTVTIEQFSCPQDLQPADWTFCCGSVDDVNGQYCCSEAFTSSETGVEIAESHLRNVRSVRTVERSLNTVAKLAPKLIKFMTKLKKRHNEIVRFVQEVFKKIKAAFEKIRIVARPGQMIIETLIESLEKKNSKLAKQITPLVKKITHTLAKSKTKLFDRLTPQNIRGLKTKLEAIGKELKSDIPSAASIVQSVLKKLTDFVEKRNPKAAIEIKDSVDKIIDLIRREEQGES